MRRLGSVVRLFCTSLFLVLLCVFCELRDRRLLVLVRRLVALLRALPWARPFRHGLFLPRFALANAPIADLPGSADTAESRDR